MKTIILSNHTSKMLSALEQKREQDYLEAKEKYASQIERIDREFEQQKNQFDQKLGYHSKLVAENFHERKPLKLVGSILALSVTRLFAAPSKEAKPPAPEKQCPDDQDRIWKSGMEGEEAVHAKLSESLDDMWTCIQGFHGRSGEIDLLLIGPTGVAAIEIKTINGHITCRGDEWVRDKYDNYENLVQSNLPIMDKGGRSPSRQLLDSARWLQSKLKSCLPEIEIYTAVVLSHSSSRISHTENLTIDELVLLNEWNVQETVTKCKITLKPEVVDLLIKKIQSLHKDQSGNFHRSKRGGRKPRNRRPIE